MNRDEDRANSRETDGSGPGERDASHPDEGRGERMNGNRMKRDDAGTARATDGGSANGRQEERDATRNQNKGGETASHRRTPQPRPGSGGTVHPAVFSLVIGLFAGLFLGLIHWFAWGLQFTRVPPAFLADPFVRRSALIYAGWQWIGLALFIAMSIVGAFVYWLALGRLRGPWPGLFFGAAWWALLFFVAGPPTGAIEPVRALGWNTIVTELCLYLVWGLFIGYSYAFEFHDEASREPLSKRLKSGGGPQPAS